MISNVYTYYLSQYAAKPGSRHDSHKKSELRNVYNRMVSINRTSPLYKLNLSEDMQKLAIDIKESAIELKDISSELNEIETGDIELKQKAVSSDEDTVEVKYVGKGKSPVDEFQIDVEQLASNQINTGHFLQPRSKELEEGTYSFDIGISGVTYELQFNVEKQDTTGDIQKKISQLINKSDMGVTASVLTDSLGNTALSIQSDSTGVRNMKPLIFTVSDEQSSFKKGAVDYLGLDRTVQHPSNAIFAVDGDVRYSANNSFTINKAFELTLKKPSEEPVTIKVEEDAQAIADDIGNFMESYNRVIDFAKNSAEKFEGGGRLLNEFERITRSYHSMLEENGFQVNSDGKIDLNEAGREKLMDKEEAARILSGLDGFRSSVMRKADSMMSNPMEYLDKKVVAYKNPARSFTSPYSSSTYAGIMFDGYY
ncbi:MAG: flagellar filament capping protein FliD [Thermoflexaceae bacterium]|nr:flagellar filament capping protein FliD [Thermoflexaceae bacterium]